MRPGATTRVSTGATGARSGDAGDAPNPDPTEVSMTSTQPSGGAATGASTPATVALRFEAAVLPVADVDRAKAFYQRLGWRFDGDYPVADDYRVVQFTPPGSPASIQFGMG